MFGDIPVKRMTVDIPKASAKRLEKNRRLIIEGNYIHWDDPEEIILAIPDGVTSFEFDFKDESDSDCIPDEDGVIWHGAPLDGRIRYSFYVEFHNQTDTRVERVSIDPKEMISCQPSELAKR